MDYLKQGFEFLDLSDVDEKERAQIISSLYSVNSTLHLPWERNNCQQEKYYEYPPMVNGKEHQHQQHQTIYNNYAAPPNVILTTNINVNEENLTKSLHQNLTYPQEYQLNSTCGPYIRQVETTLPFVYNTPHLHQPNMPLNIHQSQERMSSPINAVQEQVVENFPNAFTTLVVNSNINCALDPHKPKAFIKTKLEITRGFSNEAQPVNSISQDTHLYTSNPSTANMWQNSADHVHINNHRETIIDNVNVCEDERLQHPSFENTDNLNVESNKLPHVVTDHDSISQESNGNNANSATVKSWASLFNAKSQGCRILKDETDNNKPLALVPPFSQNFDRAAATVLITKSAAEVEKILRPDFDDPNFYRLGEYLSSHAIDNHITSLQPRGLINRSNYCYVNSILQAILACPPLYNLLNGLSYNVTAYKKKVMPVIDSMSRLVKEFNHLPAGMRVTRRVDKSQKKDQTIQINCDPPFEPSWIYKMLSGIRNDTFVVEGRQEDAEEFLGCLLNGLNDEMLELIKLVGNPDEKEVVLEVEYQESDKEWQVMGPKNKGCITRRTQFSRSPINDIFGGLLRSRIHRAGDQSTDNIQPFFTLPLNIEKVQTVNEALEALMSKNQLEGVTSSKTNEEVEAWQQVSLEELPIVLILHLKCFDYKLDGCTKIIKALEFPVDLKISSKLLSSKTNYSVKEKQYKLFAVVYHDGKEASKGHYITDAYHVGYASWLRYDDASVKAVQDEQVLKLHGTRVPYLLFYRRTDTIRTR